MSDRAAGWLLVAVAGALGIVVAFLTYRVVPTLTFRTRTFLEGALTALGSIWPSMLMVVAIAVVAFLISRNTLVRVWAAVAGIGTVVAVLVLGGVVAQSEAVGASHSFDCTESNPQTDPNIQAAIDELSHPGRVDVIGWGPPETCGGIVGGIAASEAYAIYAQQLDDAGWGITSSNGRRLVAERGGYTLILFTCGDELAIEVRATKRTSMNSC